jgi:hypothetical protein
MDDDGLPPRRAPEWKVVHAPRVAVRDNPETSAKMLGAKTHGTIVRMESELNGWIKLLNEPGWMLTDGAAVGLGRLLERVPVPDSPLTLRFSHPDDGQPLLELPTRMSATVKEVKAAVAAATGLRANAMVLARGKMGSRISDSSANLFGDSETLWACGYVDQQVRA